MIQTLRLFYTTISMWSLLWLKITIGVLSFLRRLPNLSAQVWLAIRPSAGWHCVSACPHPLPSASPALLQLSSQWVSACGKVTLTDLDFIYMSSWIPLSNKMYTVLIIYAYLIYHYICISGIINILPDHQLIFLWFSNAYPTVFSPSSINNLVCNILVL